MAIVLDTARQFASYDNGSFKLQAQASGLTLQRAISNVASLTDGQEVYVAVRYADPTYRPEVFENMIAVYHDSDNTLTRLATLSTYDGSSLVDFDNRELIVYSITPNHAFAPAEERRNDVRILSVGDIFAGTAYSNTSTSTYSQMSDEIVVTPKHDDSKLRVNMGGYFRVQGGSIQDDLRGQLVWQYHNNGWNIAGASHFIGHINVAAQSNSPTAYAAPKMMFRFGDTHKNTSGQWRVRLAGRVNYSGTTIFCNVNYSDWMEFI